MSQFFTADHQQIKGTRKSQMVITSAVKLLKGWNTITVVKGYGFVSRDDGGHDLFFIAPSYAASSFRRKVSASVMKLQRMSGVASWPPLTFAHSIDRNGLSRSTPGANGLPRCSRPEVRRCAGPSFCPPNFICSQNPARLPWGWGATFQSLALFDGN
jgi:hypothetical protein